ncbi:MAG: MBL fold metallo-hydrolase [Rhizobiaceae bacterium]|nr:MBL fold metallo-hydrolase [Rhizobiaceae bacterium]
MENKPTKQVFTVLGCSSSPGVPRPSGDWGACDPSNPKNRRRRASLLIEQYSADGGKTNVVIDTGPDFREQMISANVTKIDGVLYTHAHADHIHGIDDLRTFALDGRKKIDIYLNAPTLDHLKSSFGYVITSPPNSSYPPIVQTNLITDLNEKLCITGDGGTVEIDLIDQVHGNIRSIGLRIGNFAYCCDVNAFPDDSIAKLQGLDTLIIDATLMKPHISHFSLDQAIEWTKKLGAKRAYTTHMHTPLDYDAVMAYTPDHMQPAYDGLQIIQEL